MSLSLESKTAFIAHERSIFDVMGGARGVCMTMGEIVGEEEVNEE